MSVRVRVYVYVIQIIYCSLHAYWIYSLGTSDVKSIQNTVWHVPHYVSNHQQLNCLSKYH